MVTTVGEFYAKVTGGLRQKQRHRAVYAFLSIVIVMAELLFSLLAAWYSSQGLYDVGVGFTMLTAVILTLDTSLSIRERAVGLHASVLSLRLIAIDVYNEANGIVRHPYAVDFDAAMAPEKIDYFASAAELLYPPAAPATLPASVMTSQLNPPVARHVAAAPLAAPAASVDASPAALSVSAAGANYFPATLSAEALSTTMTLPLQVATADRSDALDANLANGTTVTIPTPVFQKVEVPIPIEIQSIPVPIVVPDPVLVIDERPARARVGIDARPLR